MSSALGEGAPFTQVEQDGTAETLTYTLPNAGRFDVDAVVATIDNSGGPDVHPILYLAAPNGEIIAKKVQSEIIPAGDTGSATWALRLADSATAAAAATGETLAVATNQGTVTAVRGSTSDTWPYANFVTTDPANYSLDPGPGLQTGMILAAKPGLYRMDTWAQFFVATASHAVTKGLSLDVPLATNDVSSGGPNSVMTTASGTYSNVNGGATGAAGISSWELHYTTYYNYVAAPCNFGFRVIAPTNGSDWTFGNVLCAATRIGDALAGINLEI